MSDALIWSAVVAAALAGAAALGRLRRDHPTARAVVYLAAVAAFALAVVVIVQRGVAAGQLPVATIGDTLLLLATMLVLLFLAFSLAIRGPALGIFMMPLAAVVLVLAAVYPSESAPLRQGVPYAATVVHVAATIAGTAALTFAFLCGLMHLIQRRRLRRGDVGGLAAHLPSLEWLERQNRRAIVAGFLLVTIGLGLGLGLMGLRGGELGLSASDPKVLASLAAWALFAALFAMGMHPRWRGHPVAGLTVIVFVLVILVIVTAGLLWPTGHMFGEAVR